MIELNGRLWDSKRKRFVVVDPIGNLVSLANDGKRLKAGWRDATLADVAKAQTAEAARMAKDAAALAAASAKAAADTEAQDRELAAQGGALKK